MESGKNYIYRFDDRNGNIIRSICESGFNEIIYSDVVKFRAGYALNFLYKKKMQHENTIN